MKKLSVAEIQTMGLVDGPGIRTVVFLQGCPLRCQYCHNPEMWEINKNATLMSPQEIVEKLLRYKSYYKEDGGVTFSGGEPLTQHDGLLEVLKLCKKNGINTCLDTSGVGNYAGILEYIDLVIMDIKAIDRNLYKRITGMEIDSSLKFLAECQRMDKKMWLRQVIVPGINDDEKHSLDFKEFIKPLKNIERVELLPYHSMAEDKYKELNIKYVLSGKKDMDKEKCRSLEELLRK